MRFRRYTTDGDAPLMAVAVLGIGSQPELDAHDYGVRQLARVVNYAARMKVVTDALDGFPADLRDYALVFVAWGGAEKLDTQQAGVLQRYLNAGGTVWLEVVGAPVQAGSGSGLNGLSRVAETLTKDLGLAQPLWPLAKADSHAVLRHPHVFAQLPAGAARGRSPQVWGNDNGLLLSDAGYAHLWQGDAAPSSEAPTREMIRAAHELGENVLVWAAQRRNPLSDIDQTGAGVPGRVI